VEWIKVAQDVVQWQIFVSAVIISSGSLMVSSAPNMSF